MKFNLYVCENNIAMKGIIYKATNSLSGMVYIGQTKSGLSVRKMCMGGLTKKSTKYLWRYASYQA